MREVTRRRGEKRVGGPRGNEADGGTRGKDAAEAISMPDNESSSVSSSRFARRMRRWTGGCVYQAERERESDYGVMAGRGGLKSRLRSKDNEEEEKYNRFCGNCHPFRELQGGSLFAYR